MAGAGQRFRCRVASCDDSKTYSLTTLYEHMSYHAKDMGFTEIFEYECTACKGAYFTNRMFMVDHKVKFPDHKILRKDLDTEDLSLKLKNGVNKMNGELLRTLFEPVGNVSSVSAFGHTPRHRERSVSVTSTYAPGTPYMMSPACSRAGSPTSTRGVSPGLSVFRHNVHPDMGNDYANASSVRLSGSDFDERVLLERDRLNVALSALSHPTMPDTWKDKLLKLAFRDHETRDDKPRSRRQSESFSNRGVGEDTEGDDRNNFGGFRRQSEGDRDDNFRGRGGFRRGNRGGFGDRENNDHGGFRDRYNNDRGGFGSRDNSDFRSAFGKHDDDRDSDRGFRGGRGDFRGGRGGRGDGGGFRGRGRGGFRGGFGNRDGCSFKRGGSPDGQNENRKRSRSRSREGSAKDANERSRSYSRSVSPAKNKERSNSPRNETPNKKPNILRRSYSRSPNRD